MTGVARFKSARPRTFTTAERMIEEVRNRIFADRRGYKDIATQTKVATSTIANLARAKPRWPRPTTLFPLLVALRVHLELVDDG